MAIRYELGLLKAGLQPGQFLKLGSDGKLMGEAISNPPSGSKKVVNLYVNNDGKLVIEYDSTPVP
jgi:hypothetical protein